MLGAPTGGGRFRPRASRCRGGQQVRERGKRAHLLHLPQTRHQLLHDVSRGAVGGMDTWPGGERPMGLAPHISLTRPILRSGCDNCNEWFHGDCIRITEKMAKAIREWYCRECRGEGPEWTGQAAGAAREEKEKP